MQCILEFFGMPFGAADASSAAPGSSPPPGPRPHEWTGLVAWRAKGRDLRLRWGSPAPDAGAPLAVPPQEAPTLESAMALVRASAAAASEAAGPAPPPPPPPQQHTQPQRTQEPHPSDRGLSTTLGSGPVSSPSGDPASSPGNSGRSVSAPCSLVEAGVLVLLTACPSAKAALTHAAWGAYLEGRLPLRPHQHQHQQEKVGAGLVARQGHTRQQLKQEQQLELEQQQQQPGREEERELVQMLPDHPARPERPRLVRPKEIPGHESSPLGLNGYMLHNLAHIELNAIDLAWDTVVRFAPLHLPDQFYEDFARVADDESRHLGWCLQRLGELGHGYGDMDAHDLLWQGCRLSAVDLGARLAVVPMSQEARGLDAGGRLVGRLVGFGDSRSAAVVAAIAEEERAHVAVGVTWFSRLCGVLGMRPDRLYRQWLLHLNPDLLKGPFNHSERSRVGLPRDWYDPTAWPSDPLEPDLNQTQEQRRNQEPEQRQERERELVERHQEASGGEQQRTQRQYPAQESGSAPSAAVSSASSSAPGESPRVAQAQQPQPQQPQEQTQLEQQPKQQQLQQPQPEQQQPQRPRRPTRGSAHPRLQRPQPRLSADQLRQLAERLALFSGLEGERAAAAAAPAPAPAAEREPAPAPDAELPAFASSAAASAPPALALSR
ncbi:hypothetical protein PLESTM_001501600 [Pleodorina starrii]|nr:hypothetical protein PLESTM_001501600 [Pleodorina starrii]